MKKWYTSKTVWLNLLGLLIVVLEYAGTINIASPEMITSVVAILNIVVRFVTTEPIERNII